MKKAIQFIILCTILCVVAAGRLAAQDCVCTNCPVPIYNNQVSYAHLYTQVNGEDNLAECPLQQVCFEISHTWVGDLSASLISPNGTHYLIMADINNDTLGCGTQFNNINVCVNVGTDNPLTFNSEYECNGPQWACLNGDNWTVPCGGVTDPRTPAVQAPNCDLNDFNTEGAPANGLWTLAVSDICPWDVGFIETFSLEFECGAACFSCDADGGTIALNDINACQGDESLLLNASPQWESNTPDQAEYGYTFLIIQDDIILTLTDTPDLTDFPAGTYLVHGLAYNLNETALLSTLIGTSLSNLEALMPFCADLSEDSALVSIISNDSSTLVNLEKCTSECLIYEGLEYCETGTFVLSYPSSNGCDSLVTLLINDLEEIDTTFIEEFTCAGTCVSYDGTDYCDEQDYEITYSGENGCDSIVVLTISFFEELAPTPVNLTICEGACAEYEGNSYCTAGNFTLTLTNENGCDSLISLNISNYTTASATVVNTFVCPDECAIYSDTEYCVGTHDIVLENASQNGCDSLIQLIVSEYSDPTATIVSLEKCGSDCLDFIGNQYCDTGIFDIVLENASYNGCDSLIQLIVSEYSDPTATIVSLEKCGSDCLDFIGNQYCDTGIFDIVLENASYNGCDSLIQLHITDYLTLPTTELSLSICEGECIEYNNTSYCQAGQYEVVLPDNNGCDSLIELTVSYIIPAASIALPAPITCDNASVTLDASASTGTAFTWRNMSGQIISTEINPTITEAGCYTLTVATQGCEDITEVCVLDESMPVAPTLITGPTSACPGEELSYTTTADPNADGYNWSIPSNAQIIGNANSHEISLIWLDNNGGEICVSAQNNCGEGTSDCLAVSMNSPTVEMTSNSMLCGSGVAELNFIFTGTPPFSIILNDEILSNLPANYNHSVDITSTTNFDLTSVTDGTACPVSMNETVTIDVLTAPVINITNDTTVCNTNGIDDIHTLNFNDLFFDNNVISGTWEDTDGSGAVGSFPLLDFYNVAPGTYTFTFTTNTAEAPCEDISTSVEIIVENCSCPDGAISSTILCADEGSFNLTALQNEMHAGTWSVISATDSSSITLVDNIFNTENIDAGNYIVAFTLSETPSQGCPDTWEGLITIVDNVYAGEDAEIEFCAIEEQTVDLFAQLQNADTGGLWTAAADNPTTGIFDAANGTFNSSGVLSGNYTFFYTVAAEAPCSDDSVALIIRILPMPQASAGTPQMLSCNQETVSLGANNPTTGITYSWSNADAFVSNAPSPEVILAGTYIMTATNEFGCSISDEVLVTAAESLPAAEINITPVSCYGEEDGAIDITEISGGVEPFLYSIDGENFSDQTTFDYLEAGVYTLTIEDANGCLNEIAFDITQPQETEANLIAISNEQTDPPTITLGESIDLEVLLNIPEEDLTSVTWTNSDLLDCDTCLSVTATPIETTEFVVSIIANECSEITTSLQVVVQKGYDIFVPNIFSPDNDGENDILTIFADDNAVRVHEFQIFSRWGETVFFAEDFKPNDPSYGWNGTHQDSPVNSGVFVWFAEIEFIDGEVIIFKGDVAVTR